MLERCVFSEQASSRWHSCANRAAGEVASKIDVPPGRDVEVKVVVMAAMARSNGDSKNIGAADEPFGELAEETPVHRSGSRALCVPVTRNAHLKRAAQL